MDSTYPKTEDSLVILRVKMETEERTKNNTENAIKRGAKSGMASRSKSRTENRIKKGAKDGTGTKSRRKRISRTA